MSFQRYEFLDNDIDHILIIDADLNGGERKKLLEVLKKYPTALGDKISDLKGISPFMCMHRIRLEKEYKNSR